MKMQSHRFTWQGLLQRPALAFKMGVRISLAAILLLLAYDSATSVAAQGPITGEWIIEARPGTDYIHLTIQRGGGRHMNSSTVDLRQENIKGLSGALAAGSGSPVQFQIVRDAGTFNCEGWFKEGKGSGHFTFTADQSFVTDMESFFNNTATTEKVYSMATLD